jgi:serine/threonine protein kinase
VYVIKILRVDVSPSPERKRRFVQEAKAASALNRPNIIRIYDISSSGTWSSLSWSSWLARPSIS